MATQGSIKKGTWGTTIFTVVYFLRVRSCCKRGKPHLSFKKPRSSFIAAGEAWSPNQGDWVKGCVLQRAGGGYLVSSDRRVGSEQECEPFERADGDSSGYCLSWFPPPPQETILHTLLLCLLPRSGIAGCKLCQLWFKTMTLTIQCDFLSSRHFLEYPAHFIEDSTVKNQIMFLSPLWIV